jgi:uncharacterized membrane protein YeaQ/YmgE (transglycosylase-associated protein family)
MHMSGESLLVILFVGLVAGWLAGQIVQGTGFGLVGDLIIGILGAFFGSWLLPQLGIHLGTGLVSAIVNATIGAVLLLLIVRLVRGGGGDGKGAGGVDRQLRRSRRTKVWFVTKTAFGHEPLTSIPGNEVHRGGLTSLVWAHPWPAPPPATAKACCER